MYIILIINIKINVFEKMDIPTSRLFCADSPTFSITISFRMHPSHSSLIAPYLPGLLQANISLISTWSKGLLRKPRPASGLLSLGWPVANSSPSWRPRRQWLGCCRRLSSTCSSGKCPDPWEVAAAARVTELSQDAHLPGSWLPQLLEPDGGIWTQMNSSIN